jgi:hypothetical protein
MKKKRIDTTWKKSRKQRNSWKRKFFQPTAKDHLGAI